MQMRIPCANEAALRKYEREQDAIARVDARTDQLCDQLYEMTVSEAIDTLNNVGEERYESSHTAATMKTITRDIEALFFRGCSIIADE